jgi:hypothetical protein
MDPSQQPIPQPVADPYAGAPYAPAAPAAPVPYGPADPYAAPMPPPAPYGPPPAYAAPPQAAPLAPYAPAPVAYPAPPPAPAAGNPGQTNAPRPKGNPNSTQNSLQIAEIRDGVVIMNDGSFRSVVMVKSINFDLMSPQEREAVEYSYQGFLNSLYFPVQIFIRSQRVDLQPYIERLDKIRSEHENMLLALLMDDYIGFMENVSQQTSVMDKKFYLVIPYFAQLDVQKALTQSKNFFTGLMGLFSTSELHVVIHEGDLNKAKDELRNRVQAVLSGLQQCGIQGLPLDTQELIELYYDTYNPDTATRQQLKSFEDMKVPVVTKGQGDARQPNLDRELL